MFWNRKKSSAKRPDDVFADSDSGNLVGGGAGATTKGDELAGSRGKAFKSSMDELQQYQAEDDDYVNYSDMHTGDGNNDDSVSIASDIVFIHGSDVTDSPGSKRHSDHLGLSSEDDDDHDSGPSLNTSYDEADGEASQPLSPRDNMLKMRHLLILGVLETERTYLAILELLLHYKRTLEASCKTSQPVISEDNIKAIFSNLQEVYQIHTDFVKSLQGKVDKWSHDQTVGEVFKELVFMFPKFGEYARNYQNAVATIHECSAENTRFEELAQQIVLTSTTREVTSLEDALFKPVQRLQRNTLVLHDLIKHTPEDHPDYQELQRALNLSQHNLENFGTPVVGSKVEEKRYLVKSSFLVELVSGWRKLRFIFLFSDVLVCTKREQHRGGKVSYECKWFIPMNVLRVDTKFSYQDDLKFSKKDDIDDLKKKLRGLKTELKAELKKGEGKEGKDKHWSIAGMGSSRSIEKLKKKINEIEAQLILSSPKLPFKVWHDTGKTHTLLMTTDYEREEWRETITGLRRKSTGVRGDQLTLGAFDAQEMVDSVKELPQVNKIGSVLMQKDEETIYGTLNVTIHKMNGLDAPCDTYCCLEMDSYGHFFMKARTHICENSADPSWNEDFELELEGSQTLRVLCYRKGTDNKGDVLLGRGALEMNKEWLRSSFQERTVALNEYSLVLSVRYTAADKTMRRLPSSKQSTAVFGVKINICARREGKTVPTIVTACVQEVERRGMDETGIYRVSGVTSDVQRIKKLFDKNVKVGAANLSDIDIHTVTGVIKLYLRELPEPLFTEANYTSFVDALKLSDEEAKEKCMLTLLHDLPDTNYYTIVYLLEHLIK
nr:hypothetical protein BaRGS_034324 [Batillaria attramentaria]